MANGIGLRQWRLDRSDYESDQEFREAVQTELAAFEHIGERLGIGLVSAPIRTRVLPDGDWQTSGWFFKTATVPAAQAAASEPSDEDEAPDEPPSLEEQREEWLHEHAGEPLPRELAEVE